MLKIVEQFNFVYAELVAHVSGDRPLSDALALHKKAERLVKYQKTLEQDFDKAAMRVVAMRNYIPPQHMHIFEPWAFDGHEDRRRLFTEDCQKVQNILSDPHFSTMSMADNRGNTHAFLKAARSVVNSTNRDILALHNNFIDQLGRLADASDEDCECCMLVSKMAKDVKRTVGIVPKAHHT